MPGSCLFLSHGLSMYISLVLPAQPPQFWDSEPSACLHRTSWADSHSGNTEITVLRDWVKPTSSRRAEKPRAKAWASEGQSQNSLSLSQL